MEWAEFPGHARAIETERLVLRPFRESDFIAALPFYADREFCQAMDLGSVMPSLDYLRAAGLYLAERGFLFAIELKDDRRPIGEVCLEQMNLERALVQPGERVFRVPIGIWDKALWGRGYGGEILDRMLELGFIEQRADRICAMSVAQVNWRSLALFESRGFQVAREVPEELAVDLDLRREAYLRSYGSPSA